MKSVVIILSLSTLLLSCQKDPQIVDQQRMDEIPTDFSSIHNSMRPYFVKFENEANKRGLSFKTELNALKTEFENIPDPGVAGQCSWSSHYPNEITIDLPFWNSSNVTSREWVMFHELGHCVLNRGHSEEQNQNGFCLSIMASGTGSCQSLYTQVNREYYLDELFSIQD